LALDDGWSGAPFSFLHFSTFSGVSKQRAFALTKNWLSEAMLATQKLLPKSCWSQMLLVYQAAFKQIAGIDLKF
jgi:hypothetical protein